MNSRYTLIISNKNFYKEVEIPRNQKKITIGTNNDCVARLRKDYFFEAVNILLVNEGKNWQVICKDNLYIADGVSKLFVKKIVNGDEFEVRYQSSDQLVFKATFQIDFSGDYHNYNKVIQLKDRSIVTFGNFNDSDIILTSPYVKDVDVSLSACNEGLKIVNADTPYGIYINGKKSGKGDIIRDSDFFSISDCFFYYKSNNLWTDSSDMIQAPQLPTFLQKAPLNYPKFIRNTRIKTVINKDKISILDPPAKPTKPKNNLILRLLPSLGMLMMAAFMIHFGGMMIAFSLVSASIAIVTTVATIIENNKDYKNDSKDRVVKYNAYIDNKRKEISEARDKERKELEEIYVSTDEELLRLREFSPNLFDRQKKDEDFLCIRLGNGDVEAQRVIDYKKQEQLEVEDNLQNLPSELSAEYKNIKNAPVICDLKKDSAVGICGNQNFRYEFLKKIITDIVARQYYTDVRVAFITDKTHFDWVDELRFIPHLVNPISGQRNIACDEDSRNQLFEWLYNELMSRKKSHDYHIVAFFIDECGFKNHPISRFVEKGNELGVTFIFFEELKERLPQGCNHIIAPNGENKGILIDSSDKNKSVDFTYETINDRQMTAITRILAPVYTEDLSLEGSLTKNLSLFELLGILSAEDIDLNSRWANSQAFKSMKAPIGVSNTGLVELDLHDKAHGPHGLVAGTTGSGKSELILTYILSMATLYHPYEVGFMIIDFKGGGMANQLKDLPHLIGTITNIDGKEINRSLKSIKAELQKRQKLFADAEVNHIDRYIQKYRNKEVDIPLPHLIIVVDEFAELKAEQPEFMKELISAARIGRSLGVHLILATQKPAGQVDDQIWSNSRFKLCLKVQGPEDSNEVLKSPLAAEIKEPGRAYLQVGNNEIFELFQSGYSGASEKAGAIGTKEFKINEIHKNGQKSLVFEQKNPKTESNITQLDAVVDHIAQYIKEKSIKKLPPICLPPLEENIPFKEYRRGKETGIVADVGIYDDPENQKQTPYSINLTNDNLMIIGSSQSGKSNLLQTIIRSVSSKYTSEEVNIYIIDFASMFLKNYENLAHVGGVVTPADDEKLKNLVKLIQKEMIIRKEKFLSAGVSSYSSYLEAGKRDIPQIILMIDNLTALKEIYFEEDDELLAICRDGSSLGINVIIANSATTGIGYKYLSNFACKIAFFCNDSNEYSTLFDHCREKLSETKGRSLVEIDKAFYECQTYLAFEGEKEIDKANAIAKYIEEVEENNFAKEAKKIPEIPDVVTRQYIEDNYLLDTGKFMLPIGIDYSTVNPVTINFAKLNNPLVFAGNDGMGQSELLNYILSALPQSSTRLYILDDMDKELEKFRNQSNVADYNILYSKSIDYVNEIEEIVKERYNILASGEDLDLSKEPLLVLVLNNRDTLEAISDDSDACRAFKNIISKYKAMNVCVLATKYENVNVNYSAPDVTKMLRDGGHFLFFDDLSMMQIVDIPYNLAREFSKKIVKGDVYYMQNEGCMKIKHIS